MVCSFCGSVLEDNAAECPYCGHKTGKGTYSEPDTEFETEEYAEEQTAQNKNTHHAKKTGSDEKIKLNLPKLNIPGKKSGVQRGNGKKESGMKNLPSFKGLKFGSSDSGFLSLVGFAACALLCIICLISVISLNGKISDINQSILSQVYQLQNSTQKISDHLDELGSTVGTVSNTLTESQTSRNIKITKEPTSAATYLGRGGAEDSTQNVPIFSVSAEGQNLTFSWQKLDDASGSWIDIVFDVSSNNEEFGLHVYTDSGKGYSELAAHGVQSSAYGSYRCVISDSYGTKNSETVLLTQRDNK